MLVVKQKYRDNPVVRYGAKVLAIGGDVTITPTPPKLPKTIKECTQSEYKELYDAGYTFFFEPVTEQTKKTKSKKVEDANESEPPKPEHELTSSSSENEIE